MSSDQQKQLSNGFQHLVQQFGVWLQQMWKQFLVWFLQHVPIHQAELLLALILVIVAAMCGNVVLSARPGIGCGTKIVCAVIFAAIIVVIAWRMTVGANVGFGS